MEELYVCISLNPSVFICTLDGEIIKPNEKLKAFLKIEGI